MSVFFDYTTFLQNAQQIAEAEMAATVSSTTQNDYNPIYTNNYFTDNPNSQVFFYSLINPGHAGTTSAIEYYLFVNWGCATQPETLAYQWQIKASGGSWVNIVTGSVTAATHATEDFGVYTTATLLPAEIQLLGTDADASWRVLAIGSPTYICSVRAIGTV